MHQSSKAIGIVRQLYRYPVKSMAGETIQATSVGWHGFDGDRNYAFLKTHTKRGFPWLTMRDIPQLVLFNAYHHESETAVGADVRVNTPDQNDLSVHAPELIALLKEMGRHDVQLVHLSNGIFDTLALSIITSRTVSSLGTSVARNLDHRRFRPNMVLDVASNNNDDYPEDSWVGGLLIFGEHDDGAQIRANKKDIRCMAINLDPDTAEQHASVLKHVVRQRNRQLGIYGSTEKPGTIRVGDRVFLVKP